MHGVVVVQLCMGRYGMESCECVMILWFGTLLWFGASDRTAVARVCVHLGESFLCGVLRLGHTKKIPGTAKMARSK